MREPVAPSARQVHADLHITLHSEQGDATAHLHGDGDRLVLDVDRPAVLLDQLSDSARQRRIEPQEVRDLVAGTRIRVRTAGRDLARVTLTSHGTLRVRPTPLGLWSVRRLIVADPRVRWGSAAALTGLAIATVLRQRRR